MADRSNDAGFSPSQQADNADAQPIETPESNIQENKRTVENQKEILMTALANQNFEFIDKTLKKDPRFVRHMSGDINSHGDTLLHAAVAPLPVNAHQGITTRRACLEAGQDLGKQNFDEDTPFHLVAKNLNTASDGSGMALTVLQELLGVKQEAPHHKEMKGSLESAILKRNKTGNTILELIASTEIKEMGSSKSSMQNRAKQAVKDIASVCNKALDSTDEKGNTPLHRACLVDNWFVVEGLLEAKTTPGRPDHIAECRNKDRDIPLHLAVREGHLETVKKLMANKGSHGTILARNNQEQTPMHVAADQGQPEILEELLDRMVYEEAVSANSEGRLRDRRDAMLHIAAAGDTEDKATRPLAKGPSGCTVPNPLDWKERTNGWTALHFAARRGHERIVELLLLNGADSKKTDNHDLLASDIARRANHIDIADFIRQYRPRSFRLELKPGDDNTAKVDDHFLVLSWPKWDKSVRQRRGELPRMWPQLSPVHQFIFNATDTYFKLLPITDPDSEETEDQQDIPGAIILAPIHQAQICVDSVGDNGWVMKERREFEKARNLGELKHPDGQIKKLANCNYVYDASVFRGKKLSTRWIHFPANNRAWIEDLCRCMYSHGSLHSDVIEILRFIQDTFEKVEGSQNYRYRKHGFISQVLERITDPPPGKRNVSGSVGSTSRQQPSATESGHGKQSDDGRKPVGRYSAYSLVFPLLDMDFIHPGFCYPLEPVTRSVPDMAPQSSLAVKNGSRAEPSSQSSPAVTSPRKAAASPQQSPVGASSQQTGQMNSSTRESAPSTDAIRKPVRIHWKNMEALRQRTTVYFSRSLDHYCHKRVSTDELRKRVLDQVLTRFMMRQESTGQGSMSAHREDDYLQTFLSYWSNAIDRLRQLTSRSRSSHPSASSVEKGIQEGKAIAEAVKSSTKVENGAPVTEKTQSPLQILTVPQLWLWKFDNLIITSFPERWDCTYERRTLLDSIRERVEYLNVDSEVEPNRLVVEILDACAAFQPTLSVKEQEFTWADAFDDEILEVSRNIKSCYSLFEDNLGKSDERFSAAFVDPTKHLRSIDDVLDELTSVRRVFQDQLEVWEKVHTGDKLCVVCNVIEKNPDDNREGGICPSNVLPKRSLELTLRLEEDALKVRESVVTLLNLLQGEASTENALKASQQAAILAVFTIVTVIFAPLSWVTSLFALEVQSFPPTWTMKDIGLGSFLTLIVTVVLCAVSMLLVHNFLRRKENAIIGDVAKDSPCSMCNEKNLDGNTTGREGGASPVSQP